jgi:porin
MSHRRFGMLAAFLGLTLGSAATLRGGEAPSEPAGLETHWRHCRHCLQHGDFAGAHESLARLGIEVGLGFTAVWQANHRGGIRSRPEGKLATSWDLEAAFDTGRIGLWPGGLFVVYLEGSDGTGIGERYVGDFFGTNADADSTAGHDLQFSEYFYEHTFGDGVLSLRVGKMDGTRDLDTNAFANDECCQFLNGAFVNNPLVPFPDYALGGQAIVRPVEGVYVAVTALDAEAEGSKSGRDTLLGGDPQWFLAAEAGVDVAVPARGTTLPGACRVGLWRDPLEFERLDNGKTTRGEWGVYASLDQMVYREAAGADDGQGLGLFARYGYAPDHYSAIEHFWSVGAQYAGLIPTRDGDVLGVGYARGSLGSPARDELPHGGESVLEAYYNAAVGYGLAVTVDVQWIRHPGAEHASAFVPGLRVQWEF